MYASLDSTMLDYYVEQYGLPYIAVNMDGLPIGFIFPQPGGYETNGLARVESVEQMHSITDNAA